MGLFHYLIRSAFCCAQITVSMIFLHTGTADKRTPKPKTFDLSEIYMYILKNTYEISSPRDCLTFVFSGAYGFQVMAEIIFHL